VNCREAFDRLGDAIDREMPDQTRAEFDHHVGACALCRAKYELERMCKRIVGQKLTMVQTPPGVQQSVQTLIRNEDSAASSRVATSWIDRLLSSRAFAPVLTAGLALVAVFFFLSRPQQVPDDRFPLTPAADIVQQSMDNFSLIQAGVLRPSMTACTPDSILTFLQTAEISFTAKVMRLKNCESYGAIVNEVNGIRLAHVVYTINEAELLYVYEAAKEDAWRGTALTLSSEVKRSLEQTGWFSTSDQQDRTVILHTVNGTLISAVSSMPKDRMMTLLTSD
jgi:anti-sigma factor (TIGR02949 family)